MALCAVLQPKNNQWNHPMHAAPSRLIVHPVIHESYQHSCMLDPSSVLDLMIVAVTCAHHYACMHHQYSHMQAHSQPDRPSLADHDYTISCVSYIID